jgi:hypothetical protein
VSDHGNRMVFCKAVSNISKNVFPVSRITQPVFPDNPSYLQDSGLH